jgi:hypothetical protein
MVELISSVKIPNNWEELVELKSVLPICAPEVVRLPEDLQFYRLYIRLVSKEIRLEMINELIGNNNICLLQNNYPYTRLLQNLSGIKHFCLWSKIGKLSPRIVEDEIKKSFSNNDFFWFENSEIVKSVPEIWHCHVFIKVK